MQRQSYRFDLGALILERCSTGAARIKAAAVSTKAACDEAAADEAAADEAA